MKGGSSSVNSWLKPLTSLLKSVVGAVLRVSMVLVEDWTTVWKRDPSSVPEYTETAHRISREPRSRMGEYQENYYINLS